LDHPCGRNSARRRAPGLNRRIVGRPRRPAGLPERAGRAFLSAGNAAIPPPAKRVENKGPS
jgi:hypothetical protein